MIVLSGNIIELGGGSYRANLFDFDTNGNQGAYLFTSSGTIPVQYQFDMIDGNASGAVWPASGVNVTVPISSISGSIANSGLFVSVLPATLSGVIGNSGQFTTVLPVNISGVFATVPIASISGAIGNSGQFVSVPSATLSGVVANSGLFTQAALNSGTINPLSYASGRMPLQPTLSGRLLDVTATGGAGIDWSNVENPSSTVSLTATTVATVTLAKNLESLSSSPLVLSWGSVTDSSSTTVSFLPQKVSTPAAFVGAVVTVSSDFGEDLRVGQPRVIIASVDGGGWVTLTVDRAWDVTPTAAEPDTITIWAFGAADVRTWKGTQPSNLVSGFVSSFVNSGTTFIASGSFVNLPKETISGVISNSGLFASVLPANLSGVFATVPIASISGVIGNSGQFVVVPPATLSGVIANSGLFATVLPVNLSGVNALVPKETISGVVANSGLTVSVVPATISGTFATVVKDLLSGLVANSGLTTTTIPATISGVFTNVLPVNLSGVNALVPKETISGVIANSGLFSTVLPANLSGVVANSGLFTTVLTANLSGLVANSGLTVVAGTNLDKSGYSLTENFDKSGYTSDSLSGTTFIASGPFVNLPKATISGVVANSGLFTTVLPGNLSGLFVNTEAIASGLVYLASGSVFVNSFASGTLDQVAINVLAKSVSGLEPVLPVNSLGAVTLKQTSRFYAPSGLTYYTDGITVFMKQQVVTSTTATPIVELGVASPP